MELNKIKYDIIFLIISSKNKSYYQEMKGLTAMYMSKYPNNINFFFVESDPNIRPEMEIIGNNIFVKNKETYIPGIFIKTIKALKYINDKINNEVNKNNIVLSSMTTCVNASSNTTSNIHFVLIKNPTSLLNKTGVSTTNSNLNYVKDNNALINRIDGISPTSTSTGIYTTGGSIIIDIILSENTNGITDLSNFNIILSPSDTVYICTYGTTSAGCDISASLSFNVNM